VNARLTLKIYRELPLRIPLPATIGSDEFDAAYRTALAGQLALGRHKHVSAARGTIGALIVSYMRSSAYLSLRETTKVGYASRIDALRTKHGHRTVAGLTRQRIVSGILQPYADRPGWIARPAQNATRLDPAWDRHRMA
jgi:enterobacteria phage integrase